MRPILFEFFGMPLPSYGVMFGLAIALAILTAWRFGKTAGLSSRAFLSAVMLFAVAGDIGARLLQFLVRMNQAGWQLGALSGNPFSERAMFGAMLLGLPVTYLYCRRSGIAPGRFFDACAPGFAVFIVVLRLGCFLAGCCYGRPSSDAFGIILSSFYVPAALRATPLYPTQLFEAGANLLIFFWVSVVFRRPGRDGQVMAHFLILYSLSRFIIEYFRGDDLDRGFVVAGLLSTSQAISLMVVCAAVVFLHAARPPRHRA